MIAREYYLGILSSRRYIPLFTSSVQWLFRLSVLPFLAFCGPRVAAFPK
jgi:hypothetical protein